MAHSLTVRIDPANPDHHLWNNNGTWWCHYTVHPTPLTKQRIRASLGTKNVAEARLRRDRLLLESGCPDDLRFDASLNAYGRS